MKTKNLFIPVVGCLLAVLAIGPVIFGEKDSKIGVETFEWMMSGDIGRGSGKPVIGAPFSAQVIVDNTRTLPNGVHISENATGALCRDSQGRIRRDKPRNGDPEIAIIDDPVAAVQYRLHLFQHSVAKISYSEMEAASHEQQERRTAETAEREQKSARAEKAEREAASANRKREAVSEPKTESLGAQLIEGVQAEGTRSTRTVPAGAMGNDKPFDIVQETWYSPALQMVVMFKMGNPARGDLVMRLANISQGEPARSLFEPPSDFTAAEKTEGSRK
jgi:hypothetical protein